MPDVLLLRKPWYVGLLLLSPAARRASIKAPSPVPLPASMRYASVSGVELRSPTRKTSGSLFLLPFFDSGTSRSRIKVAEAGRDSVPRGSRCYVWGAFPVNDVLPRPELTDHTDRVGKNEGFAALL